MTRVPPFFPAHFLRQMSVARLGKIGDDRSFLSVKAFFATHAPREKPGPATLFVSNHPHQSDK